MSSTASPFLFTLDQTAQRLGCKPRWLADQLRARRFPGHKVGRKWMLTEDDVHEIVQRCAVVAEASQCTGSATPPIPQGSSMTRTTARRLRRAGYGGPDGRA